MNILFGYGLQMLFDSTQRYGRAGLPAWLRVKNFLDEGDYIEVGVPYVPTGEESAETGYTDIPIFPPPTVEEEPTKDIGYEAAALRFGPRIFTISNTWVLKQMQQYELSDPYAVFNGRDGYKAIGIFYNDRMFSIDSTTHKEVAGQTINWRVETHALETISNALEHTPQG